MAIVMDKGYCFVSRHKNLQITLVPTRRKEIEGEVVIIDGVRCEFADGRYTTNDPKIAQKLREKKTYGRDFYEAKPDDFIIERKEKEKKVVNLSDLRAWTCDRCGKVFQNESEYQEHRLACKE